MFQPPRPMTPAVQPGAPTGVAGILSPHERFRAMEMLPYLSITQLEAKLRANDNNPPGYMVAAEIAARQKQSESYAGAGKGPVKSTVVQDMIAKAAAPQGGITSIAPPPQMQAPQAPPQQMAQAPMAQGAPQGMAGGGKIERYNGLYQDQLLAPYGVGEWDTGPSDEEKARIQATLDLRDDRGPASFMSMRRSPPRIAAPPAPRTEMSMVDTRGIPSAPKTGLVGAGMSARMSSKTGGSSVVPPAAPYVPNEIKFGSMEEAMKSIPKDSSIADYIASIKASDTSAKDKSQAIGEAFVRWGSTLASTPGSPIGALASSAGAGLTSLQYSKRQIKAEENERRKELGVASIAQGRQDLERYGIGRATLKDQADLMRANETARFNASHLNLQDVMNQRTNAAHLQGQQIAAQAHIAAGGGSEMKLILGAAKLRHDAATEAKNLADKNYAFIGKPQEKQAYIDDYVAKAFKASPHLLPYANLDMYSQQQAPGLTATPMGQQRTLPP